MLLSRVESSRVTGPVVCISFIPFHSSVWPVERPVIFSLFYVCVCVCVRATIATTGYLWDVI